MKVSVIIPAYNVEKYILTTLNSAVNQTLQDKEIIVVVDGATDNTLQIVQEFCKQNSCVKYYYQQNCGLSATRNNGLKYAVGEYVCFLDGDDYFSDDDVLERFYNLSKQNDLDCIRGAYKIFYQDKNDFIPHYAPSFPKVNKVLNGKEFLNYSIKYNFNEVVAWLGLYKREFLIKNDLTYPEGVLYEDHLFFLKMLMVEDIKIMQTDIYFYVYIKRSGSITTTYKWKNANDIAIATNSSYEYIKGLNLDKQTKKDALKYISATFYQLTTVYGGLNKKERKKCVKLVKFSLRFKLMVNGFSKHISKKIFLFNFARFVLDRHYDRRNNV